MSLYEQFGMSEDAEVHGVYLNYGSSGRIRIARAGGSNVRFRKRVEAFQKRYKRQLDLEVLEDEVATAELVNIYADTIVLGWESGPEDEPRVGIIPGPEGNDLQFSRANVVMLLTDLPDLFVDIRAQSMELGLFREAVKQADSGNS